ncbi:class E sortase [Glycomyces salinus]|uniref:class E sortase n=1 Tax=Glycomyces salinus TaxID=980294 RepID=UPI0018EBF69C|nr:class E sortase [Glycomyces salinus]
MRQKARRIVRAVADVLVALGVVVSFYAVYEYYGVPAELDRHQSSLSDDLDSSWEAETEESETGERGAEARERGGRAPDVDSSGVPVPELGDAFARMWAPDIRTEPWTLVEGTELEDIRYAPGRWMGGARPGEQGNFTLAGHNVPEIFQHIRELEPGDKVVIETREHFYVYEVTEHVIVDERQVEILAPVPERPGVEPGPDDYWMTLFTCNPLWDNYERYVVYSQLDTTIERDAEGELPGAAVDPEA